MERLPKVAEVLSGLPIEISDVVGAVGSGQIIFGETPVKGTDGTADRTGGGCNISLLRF